jgi:hypothetical protein
MLKFNSIPFGFLLGLLVSSGTLGILYGLNELLKYFFDLYLLFSIQLLMIASLAINIFTFHYYDNRKAYYTARGILLFVFFGAGFMVYQFYWDRIF